METAIRSSKPRASISRQSIVCRRHPKHQQSPGVCSICLNEKLSKISSSSSSRATRTRAVVAESSSSSSSLSSLSSSSGGSSCSSPVHRRHYGFAEDRRGFSMTFFKSAKSRNKSVLTKSRSVAVVTRKGDNQENHDHRRKKVGFWSKLLHPMNYKKRNNMDADHHHSRTLKQMMEAQVH